MQDQDFSKLKELLEGAIVLEIRDGANRESIVEFFVEKKNRKYSFTLYATDLKAWIGDEKDNEERFLDINQMLNSIFEHHTNHGDFKNDVFEAIESPMKLEIGFKCRKCKQEFKIGISMIKNSGFYELLATPDKRILFAKILSEGFVESKERAVDMISLYAASKLGKLLS